MPAIRQKARMHVENLLALEQLLGERTGWGLNGQRSSEGLCPVHLRNALENEAAV